MIQYDTNRGLCISSTEHLPGKTKTILFLKTYDRDDVVQTNAWMIYVFTLLLYSVYFLA